MLEPIEPGRLSALTSKGLLNVRDENAGWSNFYLRAAKRFLAKKNMGEGVDRMLSAFPIFSQRLRIDTGSPCSNDAGYEKWLIYFQTSAFRDLCITPGSDGFVQISASKVLIKTFQVLGDPQHWQAMVIWLWEHGEHRLVSHSIPQLEPRKLRAFMPCQRHDGESPGSNNERYFHMRNDREPFARKATAEGLHRLLEEFVLFGPILHWDNSSSHQEDKGYTFWRLSFTKSPFRSVHLQSCEAEGNVEAYAFDKPIQVFQDCNDPANQKVILEWLWAYGNARHFARVRQEASISRTKSQSKHLSRQQHVGKPLLHQVLRTASFKAQRGTSLKAKEMKANLETVDDEKPSQHQALGLAGQNKRLGKKRQTSGAKDHREEKAAKIARLDIEGLDIADYNACD